MLRTRFPPVLALYFLLSLKALRELYEGFGKCFAVKGGEMLNDDAC